MERFCYLDHQTAAVLLTLLGHASISEYPPSPSPLPASTPATESVLIGYRPADALHLPNGTAAYPICHLPGTHNHA